PSRGDRRTGRRPRPGTFGPRDRAHRAAPGDPGPARRLPRPRRPPGRRRPPPRRTPVRFGNTRIRGLGGGVLDPASGWLARGQPPGPRRAPAPGRVRVRPPRHARRFLPFHLIAPAPKRRVP